MSDERALPMINGKQTHIVACGQVCVWISDHSGANGDFALGRDGKWKRLGKWETFPSREYALDFLRSLSPAPPRRRGRSGETIGRTEQRRFVRNSASE